MLPTNPSISRKSTTNGSIKSTTLSAKKGNVFVLLNTLYASGLGSISPINPLLTGRTMHTLYAVSFLIYLMNSVVDWIHVYFILAGDVISFPLEPWFCVGLVTVAVTGSMLNGLLLALCMENAFVQRINFTPYRNGFAVIYEAIVEWIQSFNNFRVAFLVMILRDLPWTIINFLFLTSCRWPELASHQSIVISSVSIIISIMWRLVMLYFSYRRFIFGDRFKRKASRHVKPIPGIMDYIKSSISMSDGGRLDEKDESWPMRYAISKVYGIDYQRMTTKIFMTDEKKKLFERIYEITSIFVHRSVACVKFTFKRLLCLLLATVIYIGWGLVCCAPCWRFYFCRIDSLAHRHKFSKNCVRVCTLLYHYFVIWFSIILSGVLVGVNVILLSSAHLGRVNTVPPRLSNICLHFDPIHGIIQPSISPHLNPLPFHPHFSKTVCKSIWDQPKITEDTFMTKPWQTRLRLDHKHLLVVSLFLHRTQGRRSKMKPKLLRISFILLVLLSTVRGFGDKEFSDAVRENLAQEHATWLRHQKLKESGVEIEPGIEFIGEQERSHIVTSGDAFGNCQPGYTGPTCSNPICTNKTPLSPHDGRDGYGEAIELSTSSQCSGNLTIPVDSYIEALIISVYSLSTMSRPSASLYKPDGTQLTPDNINTDTNNLFEATFRRITEFNGIGYYTVSISSLDIVPCSVQVTAQTGTLFDGGFVTNPMDDKVELEVYTPWKLLQNPKVNVPSFLGAQPTGINFPGSTQTISFYNGDVLQYPPQTPNIRYNCSASLLSSVYSCTRADYYKVKFNGYDNQGMEFQRTYTFGCQNAASPSPPTTPPPAQQCYNGGTKITNGVNNSTCLCSVYYTGYQCENKLCFNGGFLNPQGDCTCAPGYSGNFCTDITCKNPAFGNFDLNNRALVFVVRTSTSMQSVISSTVYQAALQITGYANSLNPGYYRAFVLVGFSNNSLTFNQEFTNYNEFVSAVGNLTTIDSNTNCSDSVYGALSTAVTTESVKMYKRSPVFLFTDVLPNDPDDRPALFATLNDYEGQIFTIIPYSSSSTCPLNIHDPLYRDLRRLAQFTHGLVSYVPVSNATNVVFNLAMSIEETVSLAMNDFVDQCSLGSKYTTFFVDDTTGDAYIIATGNLLTITVYNTKNQALNPLASLVVGNTYIYRFNTLTKGVYVLQISADANSPCQFRILGDSAYSLFLGTALDQNTDFSSKAPRYNELTNVVARVSNIGFQNPSRVYAEAIVWSNDFFTGNRTVLYAGNGLYRDQCDFHYLFERFICSRREALFYISVFLTDSVGYTIQRVRSSYCSVPMTIPTSPEGCQNGGVFDHNFPNATNCICPNGFTGDKCQTIQCQNNGTSLTSYCQCRAGYTGQFCEIVTCSSTSFEDFSPYRRSLTFFVHDSRSTITMIQKMQLQMAQTIQDITMQHPRWINQYILVTFDDSVMKQRISTDDSGAFLTAFGNFAAENTFNNKTSCQNLQVLQTLFNYLFLSSAETYGIYYIFMRGIMEDSQSIFNQVQLLLETTQSQINFVEADAYPCNTPLTDPGPQYMWTLAGMTGGQVYIVSLPNAVGAMKTIPLKFRSGLIYEKYVPDCSYNTFPNGVNFYFPVDSETQSINILIDADLYRDPIYTYPNGTKDTGLVTTVYTDYGVSTRVDQVISPCDGFYRNLENKCWYLSPTRLSWTDAQAACAKDGAILATIFDTNVEQYLYSKSGPVQFWIGLNDRSDNQTFVWDQGTGNTPLPLNSINYLNWGTNQPNYTAGQCVSDSSINKWTVIDCNTQLPFACVKHAYNTDYMPNDANSNPIYQGIWSLNVQSYYGGCGISVWGQSGIQVYSTYVNNVHSDFGYASPIYGNYTNYIASHVTGLVSFTDTDTGSLQYAHFYNTNQNISMVQVQKYTERDVDSCKHQFVTDGFNCPGYASLVMHTGVDRYGYAFQRIKPVLCYNVANTTCFNGGVYYDNKCVCPPHYGGMQCQMPFCVNGHLASNYVTCNCANTDYTGTFCEVPLCVNGTTTPPVESNKDKTLVIILDGSYSLGMDGVLNNLQSILSNLINNATTNYPGWFTNFIGVVAYDSKYNGSIISNKISTTNKDDFINGLVNQVTNNIYNSTQNGRALLQAITSACSGADLKERSQVYVISGGIAEDYYNTDSVLDLLSFTHPAVNFFFIGDQGPPGGAPDYTRPEIEALHEFSFATGGGFYQVANYSNLQSFMSVQWASVYNSYSVAFAAYHDCSSHSIQIQIAASNTKINFDMFTMIRVSVTLMDSTGTLYPITVIKTTGTNYLFSASPQSGSSTLPPGIYTVTMNSTNTTAHPFCNLAVRGISPQTVYPAFTYDLGYDNGQHSNTGYLAPIQPPNRNAAVIQANFGSIMFAQIYDLAESSLLWASPMIQRQNCLYNFISTEDFICPTASFALAVDGIDDNGHPYRRVQISHCKGMKHNTTSLSFEENPISFSYLIAKYEKEHGL